MNLKHIYLGGATFGIAALLALSPAPGQAQPAAPASAVSIGANDLGGTVTSKAGPEAGVWVIAETSDLPTKFYKIVVTDDRGRYVIPDLPKANYQVWVRGYGLADSPRVKATRGKILDLKTAPAVSASADAQNYPPIYWLAMLKVPLKNEFPLGQMKNQEAWVFQLKTGGCIACHNLGTPYTRQLPKAFLAEFPNHADAWTRRLQSGNVVTEMAGGIGKFEPARALENFADWTDRIAKGELPFAKPSRPVGIERNLVLTEWDWGATTAYLHDAISTDRRKPTVNANGKIYGTPEDSSDFIPVLDPNSSVATMVKHPYIDPKTPSTKNNLFGASSVWGDKPIWDSHTIPHNPMMDQDGNVWFTARLRPLPDPDFCKAGSSLPAAKAFPLANSNRQTSMYNPKTGKWSLIDTCFSTHHLNFAPDADNTLWFSGGIQGPGVIGWLNTKMYEETGDGQKSQGWTPFILDTNGNGKRDDYVEPNQPIDPTKDKRIQVTTYAISVSPSDGAVWGTQVAYPGGIARVMPGPDPVHTALAEFYEPPAPGYGPRGGDVDSKGIYWVALGSGHLGRFDRGKCKVLNGPTATGKHCPEGWTLYQFPGPQLEGVTDPGSAEASYFVWVDRDNIFGLGKDVPFAMGNESSSVFALVDGKFIDFVMPYPMGVHLKGIDGRIDDPNTGWKGKALWTTYGQRTMFHLEGGKENKPHAIKLQLRPNPLAR